MLPFKRTIAIATLSVASVLTGCASTTVEITGSPLKEPLCTVGAQALATVVYWGPQWRPDQKDPRFARLRRCAESKTFSVVRAALLSPDCIACRWRCVPVGRRAHALGGLHLGKAERMVLIVVRELGPRIAIGTPAIVEGGTEVIIEVRVLDGQRSTSLANARTLWRNGGTFVVKGVGTLDQDMSAALAAALMPSAADK